MFKHEKVLVGVWRGIDYQAFLADKRLDSIDRVLYQSVLFLSWQGTGISQKALSEESGIAISNIKRHLEHLQDYGYLTFENGQDKEDGRYKTLIEVARPLV